MKSKYLVWSSVLCAAMFALVQCSADRQLSPTRAETATATEDQGDGGAVASGVPKVTICHIPPGNPENAHTITVGAPAVPAHLAHGDTLDACPEPSPPPSPSPTPTPGG